jgi:hypothetical protein
VLDATQDPPEDIGALVARLVAAAPEHGLEFITDSTR